MQRTFICLISRYHATLARSKISLHGSMELPLQSLQCFPLLAYHLAWRGLDDVVKCVRTPAPKYAGFKHCWGGFIFMINFSDVNLGSTNQQRSSEFYSLHSELSALWTRSFVNTTILSSQCSEFACKHGLNGKHVKIITSHISAVNKLYQPL